MPRMRESTMHTVIQMKKRKTNYEIQFSIQRCQDHNKESMASDHFFQKQVNWGVLHRRGIPRLRYRLPDCSQLYPPGAFGLGNTANPPPHWTAIFSNENSIFHTVMEHHPAHWGLHHHLKVLASSAAIPAQRHMSSVLTAFSFCDHFFLRQRLKAGWEI